MATINMVPEFTQDTVTPGTKLKETAEEAVGKEATDAPVEPEKETPSEPPAEEKPAGEPSDDAGTLDTLQKTVQSLQEERVKILRDLADLRGQRREIKQERVAQIEQQIDQLKDVHPEDVATIEKVLRSKGYIRKDEAQTMFYESVKQEELNKFLEKFPEYKPENDLNDINWSLLQKELGFYRMPENPHLINEILNRAHRVISVGRSSGGTDTTQKKRQLEVAGVGSGGAQRPSSSGKTLDPVKRSMLERGGFTEEDIKLMESRL